MVSEEKRAAWRAQMPWRLPTSVGEHDGPRGETTFTVDGHSFRVAPTGDEAFFTGRLRYLVRCESCEVTLHESTTSATIRIVEHLGTAGGIVKRSIKVKTGTPWTPTTLLARTSTLTKVDGNTLTVMVMGTALRGYSYRLFMLQGTVDDHAHKLFRRLYGKLPTAMRAATKLVPKGTWLAMGTLMRKRTIKGRPVVLQIHGPPVSPGWAVHTLDAPEFGEKVLDNHVHGIVATGIETLEEAMAIADAWKPGDAKVCGCGEIIPANVET